MGLMTFLVARLVSWLPNPERLRIWVWIAFVACTLAGCSQNAPGSETEIHSLPVATGPLAGQWQPAKSQTACFPANGTDGKITETGLVLRNSQPNPITISGFKLGQGSRNASIIGQEMLPIPALDKGTDANGELPGVTMLGDSPGYPPQISPTEAHAYHLDDLAAAAGFVLEPAGKSGSAAAIFVGLQTDPVHGSEVSYIEVAYEYNGQDYKVYTPETILTVPDQRDCPR